MTYNVFERSVEDGSPVELYEFNRGSLAWRFTSADDGVIFNTKSYAAEPMERTAIESTQERQRSSIQIKVKRDNVIADMWRVSPPTDIITVTVTRYHRGDTEGVVIWMGRVTNVEWSGAMSTLNCEPVFTSMQRPGLRRNYQRQCPHVLYSGACGVSMAAEKVTGPVAAISGTNLTVTGLNAYADGYFSGGFVEWETVTGIFERRFISSHVGNVITLAQAFYGIAIGQSVNAYPGCDHTLTTCTSKFSNKDNYGGFPYIPIKNPMGGESVF